MRPQVVPVPEQRFEKRIVEYGSKTIAQLDAGVSVGDCGFGCKHRSSGIDPAGCGWTYTTMQSSASVQT